jgi:hypothetical protein
VIAMRLATVVAAALAAACTIPEVDLNDRPCPCVDGWTCNPTTMRCERSPGTDAGPRVDAPASIDAPLGDGNTGTDGFVPDTSVGDAGGCFYDDFEDGVLDGWQIGGGTWVAEGGEARQLDEDDGRSYMFANATAGFSDYTIRSQFRLIRDSGVGAIELDFRVDPTTQGQQYFCNWEPQSELFLIMRSTAAWDGYVLDEVYIDTDSIPGYDPNGIFTMHVELRGNRIHCRIDELPGADIVVFDDRFGSGAAGMKTYRIAAAYDFIEVCPL